MTRTLVCAVVSLTSLSALAQSAPPPPPPLVVSSDAPLAHEEEGRVRWGLDAQLGVFLPQTAVVFGVEGRVGYQFNRLFAVYANLGSDVGIGIGASASASGASATINVVSYWDLGVQAELTLGDHFSVAAGPALARGVWAGASAGASSSGSAETTVMAAGGWMPALDAKLGFGTGARNPRTGRRSGFNIGLDLLALFAPNSVYTHTTASGSGGAGIETKTSGLAVGLVPTLTLGFDAR